MPIDEDYIASQLDVTVPMLRQLLYKLSLEHLIRYIPSDHATVVFLHHDRLRPKNVNLDPEKYGQLKSSSLERIDKMTAYINEEDTCRSSYLLEYFGQTESDDCGTCDVCRASKTKSAKPSGLADAIVNYVNVEMSGSYTLEDIVRRFGNPASSDSSEDSISTLRRLVDQGVIPSPE